MYFGLGFLVAALLALIVLPLVHARAVRLTQRRVESSVPRSIVEVQAEKDQLRAEFAVTANRLETNMEQLRSKTTQQLADLGKKTIALNQLKGELEQKTALLTGAEAREQDLRGKLQEAEDGLAVKTSLIEAMEEKIAERETAIGKLGRDFAEKSMAADSQQIEIVALRTQIAALQGQAADAQSRALAKENEHGREQALAAASAHTIAEGTRERDRLRADLEAALRIQADLRQEFTDIAQRHRLAGEQMRDEKQALEEKLAHAQAERDRALAQLSAFSRDGGRETAENAAIRNRINDVAAELVRLTALIEGAQSPINELLAQPATGERGGLAERIRQLQQRTARAPVTS